MKRKKILITIALMSFMGLMSHADPATYTFSGTGSGDVGGVLFNNEAFSIAVSADTASIVNPGAGVYFVNDIASTIAIDGFGLATFTGPDGNSVFVNNNVVTAGFALGSPPSPGPGTDLLDIDNAAFGIYDLATSYGPVFDATPFGVINFVDQATTIGDVTFTAYQDVTFTATVIPEPASAGLIALVSSGIYFTRRFFAV
jgi:hypothetical protein